MNALMVNEITVFPPMVPPAQAEPRRPPKFERSIDLAALPTALLCASLFVASTLQRWGARFLEADAELLAVEMVRHSVESCGVIDEHVRLAKLEDVTVIRLRLLGFERTIGIEVWDNAGEPARLPNRDQAGELHGLGLVDAQANDWGSFLVPGGRLVWAELGVYEQTAAGLPRRTPRPRLQPDNQADWPTPQHDLDLLRRVRDGLADL